MKTAEEFLTKEFMPNKIRLAFYMSTVQRKRDHFIGSLENRETQAEAKGFR